MQSTRRDTLKVGLGAVVAALIRPRRLAAQNPPPDSSPSRRLPGDPDNSGLPPRPTKSILDQNQKDIKKDVEKLYDLAKDLKAEVEKTDATAVLSLGMVKKAEEIEKLARQIKEHAKG